MCIRDTHPSTLRRGSSLINHSLHSLHPPNHCREQWTHSTLRWLDTARHRIPTRITPAPLTAPPFMPRCHEPASRCSLPKAKPQRSLCIANCPLAITTRHAPLLPRSLQPLNSVSDTSPTAHVVSSTFLVLPVCAPDAPIPDDMSSHPQARRPPQSL